MATDLKTLALRAIARAQPERWADADLRVLLNEMQHAARLALRGR